MNELHIGYEKRFLLWLLQRERTNGTKTTKGLLSPEMPIEDAIEAVRADPREVFTSCDCVKDERGACTGVAKQ